MTSLFVDRRDVHLQLDAGALVFRENGQRIGAVPLAPITRVFLRGNVTLEASLLGKLGEGGAGVVILSGKQARPSLMLSRPHNDARRRVAQVRLSLDDTFCLASPASSSKPKSSANANGLNNCATTTCTPATNSATPSACCKKAFRKSTKPAAWPACAA